MAMELPLDTTVAQLRARLVADYPALGPVAGVSRAVINLDYADDESCLHEGDEVVFVPPVSGGDVFEVTEQALTTEDLLEAMSDEKVGGIVLFVGVARRFSHGKRVRYLEYEAYPAMAEKKLAQIGQLIRERWPIEQIAIRHRLGHLEIGDKAVVIAVGAAHREEAFAACRFAIEEIKKSVPVWKKEVWEDGETWVGLEGG
jgi:molybdopterin synthase catalytic subunit